MASALASVLTPARSMVRGRLTGGVGPPPHFGRQNLTPPWDHQKVPFENGCHTRRGGSSTAGPPQNGANFDWNSPNRGVSCQMDHCQAIWTSDGVKGGARTGRPTGDSHRG